VIPNYTEKDQSGLGKCGVAHVPQQHIARIPRRRHRHRLPREDLREKVGVGVGVVQCEHIQRLGSLYYHHLFAQSTSNIHVQQCNIVEQDSKAQERTLTAAQKKKHDMTSMHFTINQHYK